MHILSLVLWLGLVLQLNAQPNDSAKTNTKTRSLLMRAGIEAGHSKISNLNPILTFFITRPGGSEWFISPYIFRTNYFPGLYVVNGDEAYLAKVTNYEPEIGLRLGRRKYLYNNRNWKLKPYYTLMLSFFFTTLSMHYALYQTPDQPAESSIDYTYHFGFSMPVGVSWKINNSWQLELEANWKIFKYSYSDVYSFVLRGYSLYNQRILGYHYGYTTLFYFFENYLPYLQIGARCRLFTQPIKAKKKTKTDIITVDKNK